MHPNSFLLIFYGALFALAVAELAKRWKNLLQKGNWEYTAWSAVFFLIAAFNWYGMQFRIEHLNTSFLSYLFLMIPPILYYLLVSVFTPETDEDQTTHFELYRRKIFSILALFILSNILITFFTGDRSLEVNILRFIAVFLSVLCIVSDKIIFRVILMLYAFLGILSISIFQIQ